MAKSETKTKTEESPESETSVWKKKNGKEIEINNQPGNVAYAESLGWERAK